MGIWLRRAAYLAVLGFPFALLGTRLELFDFRFGFKLITWSVMLALVVFALGLLFAFFQRKSNERSSKAAMWASILCLLPILGIGSQLVKARSLPEIHNISTDTVNPPEFEKVAQLRTKDHNPLFYDASVLAKQQIAAYPEVKTLFTDLSKSAAHEKAVVVAQALGWDIVSEDVVTGKIEATETTSLWNFKDDIVIRVEDRGDKTAIDLRSVSRVGRSDLGANAQRILEFIDLYNQ
jgi:uncharacterized protein (DUF1499 family)/cytochrome c oxidase subunit IV